MREFFEHEASLQVGPVTHDLFESADPLLISARLRSHTIEATRATKKSPTPMRSR
jgi:hypothetical protein